MRTRKRQRLIDIVVIAVLIGISAGVLAFAPVALAGLDWEANGRAICTDPGHQYGPVGVQDGMGGVIFTWTDLGTGLAKIYARKVNTGYGTSFERVPVSGMSARQFSPRLASDGAGGAIIAWQSNYDIYAQRIDQRGVARWGTGVLVSPAGRQDYPEIVSDGAGGAVICWQQWSAELGDDLYAQRVDGSGTLLGDPAGVAICVASGDQKGMRMIPDGAAGAYIIWEDERADEGDIFANRVDAARRAAWGAQGVPICATDLEQDMPCIATSESGGFVVAWRDKRCGNADIAAQRISPSGLAVWPPTTFAVCLGGEQYRPELIPDGSGGAFIAWSDQRATTVGAPAAHIYLQRLNSVGAAYWEPNGIRISGRSGYESAPVMDRDGADGVTVAWEAMVGTGVDEIYTQRVTGGGAEVFQKGGIPICTGGTAAMGLRIVPGFRTVLVWPDRRSGEENTDIYAQMISLDRFDVRSVTPDTGRRPATVHVEIVGTGFVGPASVSLAREGAVPVVSATGVKMASPTSITCDLGLGGLTAGAWDLRVVNGDGRAHTLVGAFTITNPRPTITGVSPRSGRHGIRVAAVVSGTNFQAGATVRLVRSGRPDIVAYMVTVNSATSIRCNFNLVGAATGYYSVRVTNPDGQYGQRLNGYTIL